MLNLSTIHAVPHRTRVRAASLTGAGLVLAVLLFATVSTDLAVFVLFAAAIVAVGGGVLVYAARHRDYPED